MALKPSSLYRTLRTYQIYGANTDVGKTIFSTILLKAFFLQNSSQNVFYLKPVSTGPLSEADDRHISRFAPNTKSKCLFQFDEAVSPHIAARSKPPLSDSTLLSAVSTYLSSSATEGPGTVILETAGGIHSPTPSGSSQADLYRPLRLPICLVADHKLGGISASISAFESLHLRGYDVDAVLQFQCSKYKNNEYLKDYFEKRGIATIALPLPPTREETAAEDEERMTEYYEKISKYDTVEEVVSSLSSLHESRVQRLEEMAGRACKQIWYPFTQHKDISEKMILTIDSASGDFFQTKNSTEKGQEEEGLLGSTFDGSASWWTQGLGHGSPSLALEAAYAAGRYGHVMFASAIHAPALELSSTLLKHMNNPRLSKVFYSDNGSTGIEVATKMALTAASTRYGWKGEKSEIGVLGLKGSYHGDTVGAMDCSEPSTYNERVHWYQGRGFWFDFPQVKMVKGKWIVDPPKGTEDLLGERREFDSLGEVFDIQTRFSSPEGEKYRKFIEKTLYRLVKVERKKFGALIMEPVILGAGGMLFADPLFQHTLVRIVRESSIFDTLPSSPSGPYAWTGLPIIFDEVFTGLYRLGRFSSASFLQTHPDISVHAKLLTGGLIPLCTTLASESIYEAFLGNEKRDALLHGHSYTAHAVGCHVANTSLKEMMELERVGEWDGYKEDWTEMKEDGLMMREKVGGVMDVWSVWSKDFIQNASNRRDVESVIALGSVLAINLHDNERAGYNSSAATGLQRKLLEGSSEFNIHSRVLGNVLYLMSSQKSKPETLLSIERRLLHALS